MKLYSEVQIEIPEKPGEIRIPRVRRKRKNGTQKQNSERTS